MFFKYVIKDVKETLIYKLFCYKCVGFINANAFVDYIIQNTYLMQKFLTLFLLFLTFTFGVDSTKTAKTFISDTSRTLEMYNNGNTSSISYHKDTEDGLEIIKQEVFHFSGGISMVGTFENGLRDGTWSFYYENGLKRLEGTYKKGQKDSLWTYWYDTGIKATEYFYDNKTLDGKIMEWHIDKECWDRQGNGCECGDSWWSECEVY